MRIPGLLGVGALALAAVAARAPRGGGAAGEARAPPPPPPPPRGGGGEDPTQKPEGAAPRRGSLEAGRAAPPDKREGGEGAGRALHPTLGAALATPSVSG